MSGADAHVLGDDAIGLHGSARTREDAITEAGGLLVAVGAVERSYVDAMHARERSMSTHMGNLLAIPHGTGAARGAIRRTALSFTRYLEWIDWGGHPVEFVVGIAGADDDHLRLLAGLASIFTDGEQIQHLRAARTPAEVRAVLDGG